MASQPVLVNSHRLASLLSLRFGIAFTGALVRVGGVMRTGVRAADLAEPNGFVVGIDVGWRSIEASFVPDRFAGQLLRTMADASSSAKEAFARTAAAFSDTGARLTLRINEAGVSSPQVLPEPPWDRFDLKVLRLSDAPDRGQEAVMRDSVEVAGACLGLVLALLPVEAVGAEPPPMFESGLPEGARTRVEVNQYERSPVNRAACIATYGARCQACGFDFGEAYGPLADGYIEVHHIVPVSQMGGGYLVDPVRDLVPLCANCHSVVHRRDPPIGLEALKELLMRRKAG